MSARIWNDDTEREYPDTDRNRRLDAVRGHRRGGWTADSLQRERARRALLHDAGQCTCFRCTGAFPREMVYRPLTAQEIYFCAACLAWHRVHGRLGFIPEGSVEQDMLTIAELGIISVVATPVSGRSKP